MEDESHLSWQVTSWTEKNGTKVMTHIKVWRKMIANKFKFPIFHNILTLTKDLGLQKNLQKSFSKNFIQ